eukprot:gb/GECG01002082.1/.p1 GENE.gb/GECG01002082.1/~~gb/GECG01002082.1/.p1  ORF type:complete len:158 (+),score=17.39 gb/GECG01002082.1/:1-474(+)
MKRRNKRRTTISSPSENRICLTLKKFTKYWIRYVGICIQLLGIECSCDTPLFNARMQLVKSYPAFLFMKGTPEQPMCGFSAQVVKALHDEGLDFHSVNVLDHPEIREGVKKYSDWPTIPQLYVNGEFIGGCDIVINLHQSGELKEILEGISNNSKGE